MPYSDLIRPSDPVEATVLLTRVPLPMRGAPRGAAASWAWPLAGAAVGVGGALVAWAALVLGVPAGPSAALALGAQAMLAGGLHEDGLADCADGLGGGRTPERRLEIMRDSRIGSHGALALGLVLLLRWSALAAAFGAGHVWGPLVAAGALGRWPMAALLWALPPARQDGLSRLVGRPATATLALGAATALALALAAVGTAAIPAVLAVLAVTAAWGLGVRAWLGGQTGDACGAAQQLSEAAALVALAALLA